MLPSESTKALAAVACVFGVPFLNVRIEQSPQVLNTQIDGCVQKAQTIHLSVSCPLDHARVIQGHDFRMCQSKRDFEALYSSTEQNWIRQKRKDCLQITDGYDGICYDSLLRNPQPHLLFSRVQNGAADRSVVYFDTAKLEIKYGAAAEYLDRFHRDLDQ